MFAAVDKDHNKTLDFEEFLCAVDCICDEESARELFDLVDLDQSGTINTFEFVQLWAQG